MRFSSLITIVFVLRLRRDSIRLLTSLKSAGAADWFAPAIALQSILFIFINSKVPQSGGFYCMDKKYPKNFMLQISLLLPPFS